jgi:hypothetical protein
VARRRIQPKRPGRVKVTVERVVLGALMTAAAFLLERRLRKAFRKHETAPAEPETVEIS